MINYKVTFSYFGRNYSGMQFQPNHATVEGTILTALSKIYNQGVKIIPSGRTDAGVHASAQVFSFKIGYEIAEEKLKLALNRYLPIDIRIKRIERVDSSFHARRSARSREYQYLFYYNEILPYFLEQVSVRIKFQPDEALFEAIGRVLTGTHNFVNFRKLGSNEKSTIRTIDKVELTKICISDIFDSAQSYVVYKLLIKADSFLYGMVRNLVGALWQVLKHKRTLDEFKEMLGCASKFSYSMASAKGLTLVRVNY